LPPAATECLRRPGNLLIIRLIPFGLEASQVAVAVLPIVPAKGRPTLGADVPIAGGAGSAASVLDPVKFETNVAGGANGLACWRGFGAERVRLAGAFRTAA
jgi:hypothetical protein